MADRTILSGRYCATNAFFLRKQRAVLRNNKMEKLTESDTGMFVFVQFDNIELELPSGRKLGIGWHPFARDCFGDLHYAEVD